MSDHSAAAKPSLGLAYRPYPAATATSHRRPLVEPTDADWETLKQPLIHQFRQQNKSARYLVGWMRDRGYQTTERVLLRRFKEHWGVKTNLTSSSKENYYHQLLEYRSGRQARPHLAERDVRKMIRNCKEKQDNSPRHAQLLEILHELLMVSAPGPSADVQNPAQETRRELLTESESTVLSDSSVSDDSYASLPVVQNTTTSHGIVVDSTLPRQRTAPSESTAASASDLTKVNAPLYRQPLHLNDKDKTAHRLLVISDAYYDTTLQERCVAEERSRISSSPPDAQHVDSVDPNYAFWYNIKNALYFAKIKSHDLCKPELVNAFKFLPQVIQAEHFTTVKDLFATLSPVATQRCPALRQHILKAIRDACITYLQPNHMLAAICEILYCDQGDDSVSAILLQAMLSKTRQTLCAKDPEILYLSITLISFYRRNKQFREASNLADVLIEEQLHHWGSDDQFTRLALSEKLYIYNDQGQYTEALTLAEDIVVRAQANRGEQFPDTHCIYHMEDLAEVYDLLGRDSECIDWLAKAYSGARREWGVCSSTVHISDKLEGKQIQQRILTDTRVS